MIFIRLNVDMYKGRKMFPRGSILRIRTDKDKTPLEKYWRDRLEDTKRDNCLDVLRKIPKSGFLNG